LFHTGLAQSQSTGECNNNAPLTYIITPTAPGEIYITNASTRGWKGGDTLKIPAGTYSVIEIDSFGGDPCRDIIIMNSGGLVNVSTAMRFKKDVHHVKIIGNGFPGLTYGFKTKVFAFDRVNHFTMERIEAGPNPSGVGIYGKQDPYAGQPWTQYPNYTSTKITINNCYVHDVAGEGMYIGHTYPGGDPANSYLIPQRQDSVTISNCIVTNTGWDGIQLSNARNGCLIFGNTVTNFGLTDLDGQRAGIISGGNTNSQVYNNTVINGTGNGIQFFGYGLMNCYNNTITNVGNTTHSANGEENIYGFAYVNSVETNPKQQMVIFNNLINYPKPKGAIRIWDNDNSELVNLHDNFFCFATPPPPDWQTLYIFLQQVYTNVNNILQCNSPLPVSLTSFSGHKEGSANKLYWTTAGENNNTGFEIQRSTDGAFFETIGFVASQAVGGNSASPLDYSYTDINMTGNIHYYRLRQVDFDLHSQLSSIVRIMGDKPSSLTMDVVFPNPARSMVNLLINAPAREQVRLRVTDIEGRIIKSQSANLEPGSNTVTIDISQLTSGTYIVTLFAGDKQSGRNIYFGSRIIAVL